ncbi:hypothetical protein [Planktothrix agardhii]|jgi:hypothetical protein|uniref:hypothetical protein n=1 Tax=Planktothrix agardhii TaxID=1160 RepID=UPI001D0A17CB|nr:hypothetical protein [Planktothrix agardhii]MCB8758461.1 hypothetical protein [Planktothrix agardhii 1813]
MNIKQLIKAELDHLSTQELQEFYELLKRRSQDTKKVDDDSDWDKLSQILDECQINTGITDLAYQHDHYIHGTPKRKVE